MVKNCQFRQYIIKNNLENNVQILRNIKNVYYIKKSDVYVSRQTGFPKL